MHRFNKSIIRLFRLVLGISLLYPGRQALAQGGQSRLLMQLTGIPGSSVLANYQNWIGIESFTWAVNNSTPPGVPAFDEIIVNKAQDLSSSNLLYYCAHGLIISNVVIAGAIVGQQYVNKSSTFFRLELSKAFVSSVNINADTSDDPMQEQVGFGFIGRMIWSYSLFTTNGTTIDPATSVAARARQAGGPVFTAKDGTPDAALKFDSSYSSLYDREKNISGALVPFTVSGNYNAQASVIAITWPAAPSAIYSIFRATNPGGPFIPYTSITNNSATNLTLNITNSASSLFFYTVQGRF